MIKLYNTLNRKKETFHSIEEKKVRMYVCGPTVYNYIHIGNARPAIVFDTVRRFLEQEGYDVTYVLNFTDVDDKIINEASKRGEDVFTLSERYIEAYKEDVRKLGVKEASVYPKVTDSIPSIIAFIKALIDKEFAYVSEGDVYFRSRRFEDYGKLSQQSLDELRSGARVEVDQNKEDSLDFVLWKKAKPGEVSWEAPWGSGRPGWHIECSAMAKTHLGETIDIHAGGQDLTFPHHENEIAQSESCNGKTFANYWLHNGYINIENEKMSKSVGNVVLARDLIESYSPSLIRFFILSVHYRSPINFSHDHLKQSENGWQRIQTAYELILEKANEDEESTEVTDQQIGHFEAKFTEAMRDDFNTAKAISVLFDAAKEANIAITSGRSAGELARYKVFFDTCLEVLGLSFDKEEALLDAEIEALLAERIQARANRDFSRADEIRELLKEKQIILEDTAEGTRWKRG